MSLCEVVEDLLGISRIFMKLAFDEKNDVKLFSWKNVRLVMVTLML